MSHVRKYRVGAYIPRILAVLQNSPPLTRRQIAERLGVDGNHIGTAMLDLVASGQIVKLPHTRAVGAAYRLPFTKVAHDKRTWVSPRAFAWSDQHRVSLPREPWEAMQ